MNEPDRFAEADRLIKLAKKQIAELEKANQDVRDALQRMKELELYKK